MMHTRRGYTLAELLVALTMLAAVVSIAATAATTQWRSDAALDARRSTHAQLVAGAHAVASALRMAAGDGVPADSSDLVVVTDTLLDIRSPIGASVVCAVVDAYTIDVPPLSVDAPALTWWTTSLVPGDVVVLDSASAATSGTGDGWTTRTIAAIAWPGRGCVGTPYDRASETNASRVRLRFASALPPTLAPGATLRFTRRTRWVHYRASDGRWYLGQREWNGGAWTTTQPVAGPLRATGSRGGVALRARDSSGALLTPAQVPTARVATIDVTLRADVPVFVRRRFTVVDSVVVRVGVRNGTVGP